MCDDITGSKSRAIFNKEGKKVKSVLISGMKCSMMKVNRGNLSSNITMGEHYTCGCNGFAASKGGVNIISWTLHGVKVIEEACLVCLG